MSKAPINVAAKTNSARSFCLITAVSPIMKAKTPEAMPASIVSAKAGLTVISFNMVSPAPTDSYNKSLNDVPTKNNTGITAANPSDHQPSLVLGRMIILTFTGSFAH